MPESGRPGARQRDFSASRISVNSLTSSLGPGGGAASSFFFSEFMTANDLAAMAREQVRLYEENLAEYAAIEARYAHRPELGRRMASLDFGIRIARVARDFWQEIAANPPCCAQEISLPGGKAGR